MWMGALILGMVVVGITIVKRQDYLRVKIERFKKAGQNNELP